MIRITENFREIQDLLKRAAERAGRPADNIRLLAVSKKKPLESIRELADAGQKDFAENFVQEGVAKIEALAGTDLCWHFIGHLQSNKTREVAAHFDWVHTIDRFKTARRLSEQRDSVRERLQVLIQVNIDEEPGKSGVAPRDLRPLADEVATLPRLRLRGLMCIPAVREGFEAQRVPFRRLREAQAALARDGHRLDTLSMGMTADFEAAIREGATIVRIGTALFGARDENGRTTG